jgi:uncharacterized protein (TIGR03435 family)
MVRIGSCAVVLATLAAVVAHSQEPSPPEFEVASIKRNTSGTFGSGPSVLPNGDVRFVNVSAKFFIFRAYPVETTPPEVIGAPSWTDSERYDLIAKGKPGATAAEQQQMWRALLADRMKLAAHYETRERPSYNLVLARSDRKLGTGLKPSTLDCTQSAQPASPPPGTDPRTFALNRCHSFWIERDGTMLSGGVAITDLARMIAPTVGRPVIDQTGLEGLFAVSLRYQRIPPRADAPPSPDDPPSVFTAVQEQLGLKLEPDKTQAQVLVIDRIERPSEN